MWEEIKKELDDGSFDTKDFQAGHLADYKIRWERELDIATRTNNPTVYKNTVANLDTLLEDSEKKKEITNGS